LRASSDRSRAIEEFLSNVRKELRESQQRFRIRQIRRAKDIAVLRSALDLVCTFRSFSDDQMCKDNKLAYSVDPPTTTSTTESLASLTAAHDNALNALATTWPLQLTIDNAKIVRGESPNDSAAQTLQGLSLAELAERSFKAKSRVEELLALGASDEATGPVNAVLLVLEEGDYEQGTSLTQLIISLITKITGKQTEDNVNEREVQRAAVAQVQVQEKAQVEEQRIVAELTTSIQIHQTEFAKAVMNAADAATLRDKSKASQLLNKQNCETADAKYRKRQREAAESLTNILKLRSLLLVLDSTFGVPNCSSMQGCTSASQGMCIYKTFTETTCACEPGYSGVACEKKMCPGKDGTLRRFDEVGVCTSTDNGSCNPSTGACECTSQYEHGAFSACELSKGCPTETIGGNCNGHGNCDKTTGACACAEGFFGLDCGLKKCPGGVNSNENGLTYTPEQEAVCSGHGVCIGTSGKCECDDTYTGTRCWTRTCPRNCSGRGTCNEQTGSCACSTGFTGEYCQGKLCPSGCGTGGVCDTNSGLCSCRPGFSGPECQTSVACDVVNTNYDSWAMFKPGWSKCPEDRLMTGLKRGNCNGLHCLEQAQCASPCLGEKKMTIGTCYQANWWIVLNGPGEASCQEGYYLAGLYRSPCSSIYCLQMGWCCSIEQSSWSLCDKKNWQSEISVDNNWATVPTNQVGSTQVPAGFITGMSRRGITASLDDLTQVKYCSFKMQL